MTGITLEYIADKLSSLSPIILLHPDGLIEPSDSYSSIYSVPVITFISRPEKPAAISQADLFELDKDVVAIFVHGEGDTWASMVRDENYHSGFGFGSLEKALYRQQEAARTQGVLHERD